jgi:glycosyltransferase involved in cell wall biosynthesis
VTRVAHVVVAGEIGGAERMLIDLARSPETDAEHRVFVFTPSRALVSTFRDSGLAVTDRGFVRENPAAFLYRQLAPADTAWLVAELERARPDVVHLHTLGSHVLGTRAARAAKIPVIRTEHSTRVYDDPTAWPFSRWSLARVALAVCVSQHVRDVASKKAPRVRFCVVHNGVDTVRFGASPPPLLESGQPLSLLLLGRTDPRKGVDLALRALASTTGVALTIAGDGPERASLEELARELGVADRARFVGHVADPRDAIRDCHAIVCASRKEGLGIAFLEAMAMGRPVVGLATDGVAEIVDAETSFVARPSDGGDDGARVSQLADEMARARDHASELAARGARARERVLTAFSRSSTAKAYGKIYRSVSAPPAAGAAR